MTLTSLLDYGLQGLIGVTAGVSLFKTIDLWRPRWSRMPSLDEVLGRSPAQIERGLALLERGMTALQLIASLAPFVGLAGTVLHVIAALNQVQAGATLQSVAGPVGAALMATLYGLISAIMASAMYTLGMRRLMRLELQSQQANELPTP